MKNVFLARGVSCFQDRKPAIRWFLGLKGKVLKPSVAIFGMVRRSQRAALSTSPMNCGGDTRTTEAAIRKGHAWKQGQYDLLVKPDRPYNRQTACQSPISWKAVLKGNLEPTNRRFAYSS